MKVASIATSTLAMQQAVTANDLQMALLKAQGGAQGGVLELLAGAAEQGSVNPAHLGNLVDTSA